MGQYASNTKVSAERSVDEIRRILSKYDADGFVYGENKNPPLAFLEFDMKDRRVRFVLPMPDGSEFQKTPSGLVRAPATAKREWEQAIRQRWRALAIIVKAKLIAVEEGVVEFDQEFAMHFVMGDGRTVYEHMLPMLPEICNTNRLPQLMPAAA